MDELAKESAGRENLVTAASQIDEVLEALAKSNRLVNELHGRCLASAE